MSHSQRVDGLRLQTKPPSVVRAGGKKLIIVLGVAAASGGLAQIIKALAGEQLASAARLSYLNDMFRFTWR